MKKKLFISTFIFGLTLLVAGIIVTSIGVANGGIVYMKTIRFGPISTLVWSGSELELEDQVFTSKKSVKSIYIDAKLGDITIQKANTFSIETKNFNKDTISFDENNGDIALRVGSDNFNFSFFNASQTKVRKIIVHVPASCSDLEIHANIGDVKLSGLQLESLTADLDLGSLSIRDSNLDYGDIELNQGDLTFQGDFTSKLTIENNIGSVDVILAGKKDDYNLDLKATLGTIKVKNQKYRSNQNNNNNSKRNLSIQVDVGDINLDFKK